MAQGKAVAFLAREIGGSSASEMLFRGALTAVERSGQDLVVFRGGYFGKDPGSAIYGLVNEQYLGAINWASSDKDTAKSPEYKRYEKLPFVTLTQQLPPHPVVANDSHSGMRSIVEHLVRDHGRRRIAFFRGPEGHPLAQERLQAYQEVLRDTGIAADERLVSPPGNWDRVRGNDMLRLLIDERGLKPGQDFDAVVCVNDNLAIGTILECQRRGIRVPEDLAVTGCNDIFDSRVNMPPVTTVALPGDAQVIRALDVLNAVARGEQVPPVTKLPGQAIMRQSCGCASHQVEMAASGMVALKRRFDLGIFLGALVRSLGIFSSTRARSDIVTALLGQLKANEEYRVTLESVAEQLTRALGDELGLAHEVGAFNKALVAAIKQVDAVGIPVDMLHLAISVLRRHRLPSLWRRGRILRAEDVFSQARVLLSEMSVQIHETASMKALELERSVSQLGARMTTIQDTGALIKLLQQELPKLGIPAFYLALYEGGQGWDRHSVPSQLRMLMTYDKQGGARLDDQMPVTELIPRILRQGHDRKTLIVVPLHFNEIQIGVAVFTAGPWDGTLYESLKVQLSSSLYGSLLRQTLRDTLSGMERRVAAVSSNSEQIKGSVRGGSSAMEDVANSIHGISQHVQEVTQVIRDAVKLAAAAANDIVVLNQQSQEINKVSSLITEIAEQTNMLSLNAAIEAARAGDAGRGFAVVAEEVKSLAVNTVRSSANIRSLIQTVQENTVRVRQSIDGMNAIMKKIEQLSSGIAGGISEQEVSTNEIANILTEAAQGTEEIAAALAELDALSREAGRL